MTQKVAIIIDNLVAFYSIRQGIDELLKRNISLDIYTPADDINGLADTTFKKIKELGYKPLRQAKKQHYRLTLEPYPKIEHKESLRGVTTDYRIKYKYSLISAKPNPLYTPLWNIPFDAILVHSAYENDLFKTYAETYCIKPMIAHIQPVVKKPASNSKKTLLFLPTFDDTDPEQYRAIGDVLTGMKKEYKIIIKTHHATQYRADEQKHHSFLKEIADHIYDQTIPLAEIMNSADVVLTGNSGSIYEALYYGKPVSVFTDNPNKHKFAVDTLHFQLINRGIIPFTSSASEIPIIVKESFKKINIQNRVADEQFRSRELEYLNFIDVIIEYINRDVNTDDRHVLRKELNKSFNSSKRMNTELQEELRKANILYRTLAEENRKNKIKIHNYDSSLSWGVTKPLREVNKIIKKLIGLTD